MILYFLQVPIQLNRFCDYLHEIFYEHKIHYHNDHNGQKGYGRHIGHNGYDNYSKCPIDQTVRSRRASTLNVTMARSVCAYPSPLFVRRSALYVTSTNFLWKRTSFRKLPQLSSKTYINHYIFSIGKIGKTLEGKRNHLQYITAQSAVTKTVN